jgi:alpha-tubulin suppressor-like RCC1 family protein
MSERYPGGLISKTPPAITGPTDGEGGSASGMWSLAEVAENEKAGSWPKKLLARNVFAIGRNTAGSLGQNDVISRSSPVQVGSSSDEYEVARAGVTASYLIKKTGELYFNGSDYVGTSGLSVPSDTQYSSPTQIGALTDWSVSSSKIANASLQACAAIKTDGTLWTWGMGNNGRTGHNDTIHRSSPVQVGSLTDWSQVNGSSGFYHAVKTDGTLWGWGTSTGGSLGTGGTIDYSSPVQIGALTTWAWVAGNNQYNGFAIKTDGTLWAWGSGTYGNNGQNNTTQYNSPVQVGALTTWSRVQGSYSSVFALKTDGTLWAWGRNIVGECGLNTTISYSSPVQVGSDTDWSDLTYSGYGQVLAAVKTDGSVYACGVNTYGAFGQDDTISYSSPVQVGSGSTWNEVSTGNNSLFLMQKV